MTADDRVRWLVRTPLWQNGERSMRELSEIKRTGELLRRLEHVAV